VAAEVGCLLGCQHSSPWCRWDQHRWGEPHSNQPVGSTCSLPSSGLAECTAEEGDSTAAVGRPSTQFPKEAGVLVSCGDGKHGCCSPPWLVLILMGRYRQVRDEGKGMMNIQEKEENNQNAKKSQAGKHPSTPPIPV